MTGTAVDLQGWARSWLEFVLGLDRPLSPVLVQDGEWHGREGFGQFIKRSPFGYAG